MTKRGLARVSPETARVYRHFRETFGDRRPKRSVSPDGDDQPFQPGRDPNSAASALDTLSREMGWDSSMAQARIAADWRALVGDQIADHTRVVEASDGRVIVECDSSAWATQLRLIRHDIIAKLAETLPDAAIDDVVVRAPGAPSWSKGPRRVPGRGPRDTYG